MFTEYDNLPDNSIIWIYQSDRIFTESEIEIISKRIKGFIEQWTSHGDDLKGSFTIKYNQFLIFGIDESFNDISGCSIDSLVHFVKQLENDFKVDFMDKMNISFMDNGAINVVKLSDFQSFVKDKKITPETIVFNNMVATKGDFKTKWEVTANKSWHKRFLS